MQIFRNAHLLARLVLVWFALAIGVAIASPIVKPQSMELICSAAGLMKLQTRTDDGTPKARNHTLDCPFCTSSFASAPPPVVRLNFEPAVLLDAIPHGNLTTFVVTRPAAPLPARGPPVFS